MSGGADPRPLTGRKVLIIALAAFGVILAANLTLMFTAINTFSGLVVPNSYVASQSFDARRMAQEALGWTLEVAYEDGALALDFTGPNGAVVRPQTLAVTVGRPTSRHEDLTAALDYGPTGYTAVMTLEPGNWNVEVAATAPDGTEFLQRRSFYLADGG